MQPISIANVNHNNAPRALTTKTSWTFSFSYSATLIHFPLESTMMQPKSQQLELDDTHIHIYFKNSNRGGTQQSSINDFAKEELASC